MTAYTFDQIIDFTRTSAATYVANTGFVTQTPASRNLLTYTQEFDNAAWTKSNANAYSFDPAAATYGAELVTNGTFDSGTTGWTPGPDWSISAGAASKVSGASAESLTQTVPLTSGMLVRVTYTVTAISGVVFPRLIGTANVDGVQRTATGVYTDYLVVPVGYTSFAIRANSTTTVTVDNISVREVIGGLITAPDGTSTADKIVATATTGFHGVFQSVTGTVAPYTLSVYAKAAEYSKLQLANSGGGTWSATFDLETGTTIATGGASVLSSSIQSAGSGWYRCSVTFTGTASLTAHSIAGYPNTGATLNNFGASYAGNGTSGFYIWGAQLEAASAASTYTRNNGGVYPPRFDYDPVTRAPRGLLIEEQRTNLLTYSEEFDNASWTKTNATVTANATTSPDGTADADKLVEDTSTNVHFVRQSVTVVASTTYTYSVYLKAAERGFAQVRYENSGSTQFFAANVDLSSGAVTTASFGSPTGTAASATSAGNGWWRVNLTVTASNTTFQAIIFSQAVSGTNSYTGDGTSGIYLWGAQLEAGSFATSYIPTVASQVTRTADQATVTGANFSRWYNQSEGTLVLSASVLGSPGAATISFAQLSNGSSNNFEISLGMFDFSAPSFQVVNSTTQANLDLGSMTAGQIVNMAGAYKTNDFAGVLNGGTVQTDTSGSIPSGISTLGIGFRLGGVYMNGHIRRIRYYPTRLSNTQLQALTA